MTSSKVSPNILLLLKDSLIFSGSLILVAPLIGVALTLVLYKCTDSKPYNHISFLQNKHFWLEFFLQLTICVFVQQLVNERDVELAIAAGCSECGKGHS